MNIMCPYCFVEIDKENLKDHMIYSHDYSINITHKEIIERFKKVGIHIKEENIERNKN